MKKFIFMLAVAIMAAAMLCPAADAQEMSKKDFKNYVDSVAVADNKSKKEVRDSLIKLDASLAEKAEMTFKYTDHNFGNVESGSDVSYDFEFINTGKEPLVINNVSTSCGCTTPSWPREPIPSKGRATIKVRYDSNRIGNFSKTITVYSNSTNSPVVLSIKGSVQYKQK
jgi:flagellar biosynthesis regulator FlaF